MDRRVQEDERRVDGVICLFPAAGSYFQRPSGLGPFEAMEERDTVANGPVVMYVVHSGHFLRTVSAVIGERGKCGTGTKQRGTGLPGALITRL